MRGIFDYLREGVWERDLRREPWHARFGLVALRTALTAISNIKRHRVSATAGSMTVTTLLSIVPLAALVFTVARGFGLGDELDQWLVEFQADLPAHFQEVVQRIRELVADIDFGRLGLLSTLIVAYAGLSLFMRAERALNLAWEASRRRSWFRRVSDFVTLVVVVPPLALGAMTLGTGLFASGTFDSMRRPLPFLGWLYDSGLALLPHALLSIALTGLYKLMPNTRVEWRSALIGGVAAGFSLMFMHDLYLSLQQSVARANAIYATLAALPLLIVYLQLAWTIVLLGAEVGHAVQHASLLHGGKSVRRPSPATRERIALSMTERAVRGFARGEGGAHLATTAIELDVARSVLDSVCDELVRREVLARVGRDQVMPAKPGEQISCEEVIGAVRGRVSKAMRTRLTLSQPLEDALRGADDADRSALAAIRFS